MLKLSNGRNGGNITTYDFMCCHDYLKSFETILKNEGVDLILFTRVDEENINHISRIGFSSFIPPFIEEYIEPEMSSNMKMVGTPVVTDQLPLMIARGKSMNPFGELLVEKKFFSQLLIPIGRIDGSYFFVVFLSKVFPFTRSLFNDVAVNIQRELPQLCRDYIRKKKETTYYIKGFQKILQMKNEETLEHMYRVGAFGKKLALEVWNVASKNNYYDILRTLDCESLEYFELAATIHDLGKLAIPDGIIKKPGKLTSMEFDIIKTHPDKGLEILDTSFPDQIYRKVEILNIAKIVVKEHHERFDGSGYPRGLIGEQASIFSRIACVSDVFDAIISDRIYKKGKSVKEAIKEITEDTREKFDPIVIEAFLNIVNKQKNSD